MRSVKDERPSITCPECGMRSYHPKDIETGYCGRCNKYTTRRTHMFYEGMQEITCPHCGTTLGYQAVGDIHPDWEHARCPARVAKNWDEDCEVVQSYVSILTPVLSSCFPEVTGLSQPNELFEIRGRIAAEQAIEALDRAGYKIGRK